MLFAQGEISNEHRETMRIIKIRVNIIIEAICAKSVIRLNAFQNSVKLLFKCQQNSSAYCFTRIFTVFDLPAFLTCGKVIASCRT